MASRGSGDEWRACGGLRWRRSRAGEKVAQLREHQGRAEQGSRGGPRRRGCRAGEPRWVEASQMQRSGSFEPSSEQWRRVTTDPIASSLRWSRGSADSGDSSRGSDGREQRS